MEITLEWLEQKFEEIKKMQEEIDNRIEQLKQQKLMNYGAIAMINEMKKEINSKETNTF
jgi:CII-binding regulator of phage lambda lysogenization HflD